MWDIKLTPQGDLEFMPDGDLASTDNEFDLFVQYVWLLLKTFPGTGFTYPDFGLGVDRYLGLPEVELKQLVKEAMKTKL